MSFPITVPNKGEGSSIVPPGFRFHPTDEELVSYYLTHRVLNRNLVFEAIGEVDLNKCEPWDLPTKANLDDQTSFYFFTHKDKKYPTGRRTNRATEAGYWKATGKDREVTSRSTRMLLGMKKTLVFYTGRAPNGHKTNWIMHEYRLESESIPHQEWVVCRVYEKSELLKKRAPEADYERSYSKEYIADQPRGGSFLPDLQDLEFPRSHSEHAGNGSLAEQVGYLEGAMLPTHEPILRRSNSRKRVKGEPQLADSIEYVLAGWDMYTPESMWDVSSGP